MKVNLTYFSLVLYTVLVLTSINTVAQNKASYAIMPAKAFYTLEECIYPTEDFTVSPCSWHSKFQRPHTRKDLNDSFKNMFFSAHKNYPVLREFKTTSYSYDKMDDLQIRSERELFERLLIELDFNEYKGKPVSRNYAHRWAPLIHHMTKGDVPDFLVFVVCHGSANVPLTIFQKDRIRGDMFIFTIVIDTKTMEILPVITTSSKSLNAKKDKKITEKRFAKLLKKNQKNYSKFYLKEQKQKQKAA